MSWQNLGKKIGFAFSWEKIPFPSTSSHLTQDLFDCFLKAQQGDNEAFQFFLGLCHYRFLKLGHGFSKLMKGKEITPDLVQESMLILYSKVLESQFSSKCHLDSFLSRILNNVRINRYKRMFLTAKRKIGMEVSGVDLIEDKKNDDPSTVLEKTEDLEKMAKALKILNDKEQAVLRMRHQDGMTWEEIGHIAGMSADSVRKAYGRIIGLLRSAMGLKVNVDWLE